MPTDLDYGSGFIYCVAEDDPTQASRCVKIGWAFDPEKRLRQLQTGNPRPLRLLCVVPGGLKDEKQTHKQLAEYRIREKAEWFGPVDALVPLTLATTAQELVDAVRLTTPALIALP